MTLARRISKLEESLSPTELVVRWLAEAHTFGSIDAYVDSLVTSDPVVTPLDRLAREAVRGAQAAYRGKRPETIEPAVRTALRETVFRYELVLRINMATRELLDREVLLHMAISAQLALLLDGGPRSGRTGSAYLNHLARYRDMAAFRAEDLSGAEEARRIAQDRYLAGHEALFPATAEAWTAQFERTQSFARLVVEVAQDEGVPAKTTDPDADAGEISLLVAGLAEPARAAALETCGETTAALRIAMACLRRGGREAR